MGSTGGPGTLGGRLARTALGATAGAAIVAAALGGPSAAAGVVGIAAAAVLWARATWWPSIKAVDALTGRADALRRGEDVDLEGLVGPAARIGQAALALGSARQEAEARARSFERRLQATLDATPTGVLLTDGKGRITRVNVAMRQMMGLSTEPEGRLPVEALRAPELLEVLEAARTSGQTVPERAFATADRDLTVSAHPMDVGTMLLVRDVTHTRVAERARTDFVANVSHELRTPIAAILGYAESLLAEPEGMSDDVVRMIAVIERHGRRLHRIFEDLLTLHKLEARRKEFPREPRVLAPLVREAVSVAADTASVKGIEMSVDVPEDLVGLCNGEAVRTIVGNLAGNAIKYTPEGGRVSIVGRRKDDCVFLDVSDTGPGIPVGAQDRVFERFFRVDDGRSRDIGGTGLGLAIVKHLAEATQADVTLRSEPGKGSTFTLRIPVARARRSPRTWDATLDAPPTPGASTSRP